MSSARTRPTRKDVSLLLAVTSLREDLRHKVPPTGFAEDASEMQMPVSQLVMAHGQTNQRRGGDSLNARGLPCPTAANSLICSRFRVFVNCSAAGSIQYCGVLTATKPPQKVFNLTGLGCTRAIEGDRGQQQSPRAQGHRYSACRRCRHCLDVVDRGVPGGPDAARTGHWVP